MNLKNKFAVIAGSALIAGGLLTGAAFAATNSPTPSATAPAKANRFNLDQAVADGKITQAEADVLKQLNDLRTAAMEKLQTESKAIIDQAVKDGKITQEQADALLNHGGRGGFGHGGFGPGGPGFRGMTQEELKAHLDAEVKAGKLTQEQADQILSGEAPTGFGRGGFRHGGFFKSQQPQQSQSN